MQKLRLYQISFSRVAFAINDRYRHARDTHTTYKIARLHVRNNKRARAMLIACLIGVKSARTMIITFGYRIKVISRNGRNEKCIREFPQIALPDRGPNRFSRDSIKDRLATNVFFTLCFDNMEIDADYIGRFHASIYDMREFF